MLDKNTLDKGQIGNKLKLEVLDLEDEFEGYRNGLEILDRRINEERELIEHYQKDNRAMKQSLNDINVSLLKYKKQGKL